MYVPSGDRPSARWTSTVGAVRPGALTTRQALPTPPLREDPGSDEDLDAVLAVVHGLTGVDFAHYRRATVERRVLGRMHLIGIGRYADYEALLTTSPGEAQRLLERVTIKVSRFYRHPRAFEALRQVVLPDLLRKQGPALSIWSAGVAHGEEAYTLAMLLESAGAPPAIQVLGTDIDEGALAIADAGVYPPEALADLPHDLRRAHLREDLRDGRPVLRVSDAVRKRVRFMRHDVTVTPAPAPGVFDLVACRNVLIYLRPDAQDRVLLSLCRAVRAGGFLALGEAEWPCLSAQELVTPLDHVSRLFRRGP